MVIKKARRNSQTLQKSDQAQKEEAKLEIIKTESFQAISLPERSSSKEKERQKKKKKRRKADKRARDEEGKYMMIEEARRAEVSNPESHRFLVAIPLANVSHLSGGSVCKHFRKGDLTLNGIRPVALESLLKSIPAKAVYDSLNSPIYFVRAQLFIISLYVLIELCSLLLAKRRLHSLKIDSKMQLSAASSLLLLNSTLTKSSFPVFQPALASHAYWVSEH